MPEVIDLLDCRILNKKQAAQNIWNTIFTSLCFEATVLHHELIKLAASCIEISYLCADRWDVWEVSLCSGD